MSHREAMRTWRIPFCDGAISVEAETEEAARQEAIMQITTARIRVWVGWILIDLSSGTVAIKAENEQAGREQAISEIKTAKIRVLKYWIVDLGSFYVEAVDEDEAYEEAKKQIKEGDIEISQIFEND